MPLIEGGYYIKAKKIQESDIANAPPHIREIWDWLLLKANWKPSKGLERGQLRVTYDDIRNGLHWMIGWRKMTYSKWDCEGAMKWLKKAAMVTTQKTTKGMIITVLNYEKYQDPDNYKKYDENHKSATREPQTRHTIREEVKKEEGKKYSYAASRKKKFTIEGDTAYKNPQGDWMIILPSGNHVKWVGPLSAVIES